MCATVVEEPARLRRTVRMKAPDAIIAATALLESATLVTRNAGDFVRVPRLRLSKY
jgi:predicted nucleic acid-binding protein